MPEETRQEIYYLHRSQDLAKSLNYYVRFNESTGRYQLWEVGGVNKVGEPFGDSQHLHYFLLGVQHARRCPLTNP